MTNKKTAKKKSPKEKAILNPLQMGKLEKKRAPSKKIIVKAKKTCFVTIPFMPPFDLYYETIYKPAIRAATIVPLRADDLFRPSPIVISGK